MKRDAVQIKFVGTLALALASLPLPLLAQSPVAPAPAPLPALAPVSSQAPLGALPPLNLPTVVAPETATAASAPAAAPASPAPEIALPAVSSAPSASTPSAAGQPAVNQATAEVLPVPKVYSFGESELSILFLPDQVTRMKDAIRTFEDTGKDADKPAPAVPVLAAPAAPEVIEDPLTYPVFYLSSILYKGAGDWSLWISGYKITSQRNYTDVTVLNVSRDSATFLWKPSFMKAITRREKDKLFASTDSVKHKLVPAQSMALDPAAASIVFTLKPNQSFAPGYFKIFEGYIDAPTLTALPVVIATGAVGGQPGAIPTGNEVFDASGNPIKEDQDYDDGANFAVPSTNFNSPTGQ